VCEWIAFHACYLISGCVSGSWSVRGNNIAVSEDRGSCVVLNSGCVVMGTYPCVVLEQCVCGSGSLSVRGTRAVALG
jgi:hypothetical protein